MCVYKTSYATHHRTLSMQPPTPQTHLPSNPTTKPPTAMSSTTTPATLVVSFPATNPTTGAPITFNKDYYFNVHMANVAKAWAPFGYLGYQFLEHANPNPLTGEPPEYAYQNVGYFETMEGLEGLEKAVELTKEEAVRDVGNFVGEGVVPGIAVGVRSREKWF
ncbi:hypothetical protein P171DRAFT_425924, partial [Karstenula rhodostoma CBS 690.94]